MRRSFTTLLLFLLSSVLTISQAQILVSFNLDQASFAYDEENCILESYLGFDAKTIPFQSDEGQFSALIPIQLELRQINDTELESGATEPVVRDAMQLSFATADTSALQSGQTFIHQLRHLVPPGTYELEVKVLQDPARNLTEFKALRQITVNNFRQDTSVGISDITLASRIEQTEDATDPFYKSGLVVQPNPTQLFGNNLPRIYYYAEGYNLPSVVDDENETEYTVLTYIAEANLPQPLPNLQRRQVREIRQDDIFVGAFNISSLPSGSYFLRMAVLNQANEAVVEQNKKFFVYNPNVVVDVAEVDPETEFRQSVFANMNEEEANEAIDQARIIATDQEIRRMRALREVEDKKRFLAEFWKTRDPNPSTLVNEYYNQFYELVRYTRERYASAFNEGWKSDRGRAILRYGMPSSVEPHMYDRETVPHEIWQYNNIPGEGQAIFVFADIGGFGEIELLHSSVLGERKDPDWQNRLRR